MPEYTHVELSGLIHLIVKAHDRFGERLIYSFVEPRQFVERPVGCCRSACDSAAVSDVSGRCWRPFDFMAIQNGLDVFSDESR